MNKSYSIISVLLAVMVVSVVFSSTAIAQKSDTKQKTEKKLIGDPYTLNICAVTGEELGKTGDPIIYDYKGREVRFCSKACIEKFENDAEKYIKKVDEELIKAQLPHYPLDACIITGEKFGEGDMGEPVNYIYNNRLVRFCCKGCIKSFEKDPAKHLDKLNEAVIEKQLPDYPSKTCAVLDSELGSMGKPINLVVGNRLIRLCCKGCIKKVQKDPVKYIAKVYPDNKDK